MRLIDKQEDRTIFYACLILAACLLIGSFFCPPMGIIDGSVLTAVAELLGFASLGIVGKNLARGKDVTFQHGKTEITIGENNEENNDNN